MEDPTKIWLFPAGSPFTILFRTRRRGASVAQHPGIQHGWYYRAQSCLRLRIRLLAEGLLILRGLGKLKTAHLLENVVVPRAILRNGVICPIEPLPPEWTDGRELRVEDAQEPEESAEAIDKWYQDLQTLAADIDAEDEKQLLATIAEVRREAKELARREMESDNGRISPGHESSQ